MIFTVDLRFIDAANKAAELRRVSDAAQWEIVRQAIEMGFTPISFSPPLIPPKGMPHVALFPIARLPR
jgi:hypothetical protein